MAQPRRTKAAQVWCQKLPKEGEGSARQEKCQQPCKNSSRRTEKKRNKKVEICKECRKRQMSSLNILDR